MPTPDQTAAVRTAQRTIDLELAVQDVDGVRTALAVGAARVELCAALGATGGLTPSVGLVERATGAGIPVHVLIRPRPGSFVYSAEELSVAEADVHAALRAGAAGIVFGALTPQGAIDERAVRRLVAEACDRAPATEITFHRAIDTALSSGHEPERLLEALSRCGITRVLTSGGSSEWSRGLPMLGRIVAASRQVEAGPQIMAGGGVRLDVLGAILDSGVDAIHASAKHRINPSGVAAAPGQGLAEFEATGRGLAAKIAAALPLRTH